MSTTDFFILNISVDNRAGQSREEVEIYHNRHPCPAASVRAQRGAGFFTSTRCKKSVMYWLAMLNNIMIESDIESCDDNRLEGDRL